MIISGKDIKEHLLKYSGFGKGKKPRKVVFIRVGNDASSEVYVRNKNRILNQFEIETENIILDSNCKFSEIKNIIEDNKGNYILIQLPLPKHLNEREIMNLIPSNCDIDCQTDYNLGKIMADFTFDNVMPCTSWGILKMIDYYYTFISNEKINSKSWKYMLSGKTITVVGRSNIVGKPTIMSLVNRGATVICCNSGTENIREHFKKSDIVILAVGKAGVFNINDFPKIKEQLIIDVGINPIEVDGKRKVVGDFDATGIGDNLHYTPVPGGVGVLTVLGLLNNYVVLQYLNGGMK